MMNSAQKRKGRGNSSSGNRGGRRGFEYQRSFEQPRNYESQRSYEMQKSFEKPSVPSGVFGNPRFTHVATSLVGCVVQLQVKNGGRYEGIFKTFNGQMDVVLEMAHKCDDSGNNNHNSISNMPSKDRLIEKVIFHFSDILTIDALNVELDYAVKDTFTDAAISKSNGQVLEKDLRELQPWDGEGGEELGSLTADSSNGWDPDEMFRRNAEQFNVQSTYDDTLKQYTIPLQKRDTKEYKEREERAAKIANEIEKTEAYRQRIALENGEEETEEDKYSAVKRNNENNSQVNMQTSGKYIPPPRRNQQTRNVRGGHVVNHHVPNKGPVSPVHSHPPPPPPQQQSSTQQSHIPPSIEESKFSNGNSVPDVIKDVKRTEPIHTSSTKPSPVEQSNTISETKSETLQTSPLSSKIDRRNSNPKARDVVVQELKDFSTKFKVHLDEELKEKESKEKEEKVVESSPEVTEKLQTEEQKTVEEHTSQEQQTDTEPEKDVPEVVKNSSLNPMAKEFNPTAKPFTPKQPPPQVPTPPRPQTQSPIIQQLPPAGYFAPQSYMMPPSVVSMSTQQVPTSQPHNRHPKRAVVSVHTPRPDLTAAAAQAATGQPLLAQSVPQQYMYTLQQMPMVPQPTGYQVGQVMPMPAATPNGPRMVNPNLVPTSHQSSVDHSNQSHSGHMFMGPPGGPVPAHLPNQHHQQYTHPQPAHMGAPHTNQHQQHQHQQQQPHPAPSPVQQHTGSNTQSHTQAPPPPSGTPQPHNVSYQQINIQGQPPLQPSPHNPTSPQTMHPISMPYHFPMAAHNQQGNQQHYNNMTQQNPPPTTVAHTIHSQHMHHQPQLVMMPQPQPNQVQQQQQQHSHQFQGHHMAGQGSVHGQSHMITQPGALQTNNPTSIHPHQMHHFVPPGKTFKG